MAVNSDVTIFFVAPPASDFTDRFNEQHNYFLIFLLFGLIIWNLLSSENQIWSYNLFILPPILLPLELCCLRGGPPPPPLHPRLYAASITESSSSNVVWIWLLVNNLKLLPFPLTPYTVFCNGLFDSANGYLSIHSSFIAKMVTD
jgi:hypothetical protein